MAESRIMRFAARLNLRFLLGLTICFQLFHLEPVRGAVFHGLGKLFGQDSNSVTAISGDGTTLVGKGTDNLGHEFLILDWISKPYRWSIQGGAELPESGLPEHRNDSYSSDVSNDGKVVVGRLGQHRAPTSLYITGEAFVWNEGVGLDGLKDPNTSMPTDSNASAVSGDGGVVVGWASNLRRFWQPGVSVDSRERYGVSRPAWDDDNRRIG